MKTINITHWVFAAAVAFIALPAMGQVVRVNAQAQVEPRMDVRLGDIATVSGTDRRTAEDLANTVILSGVDGPRTIKAEAILLALMAQRGPQTMSNLQLAGSAQCAIRVGESAAKPEATRGKTSNATQDEETPVLTASAVSTPAAAVPGSTGPRQIAPTTAPAVLEPTLQKVIEARIQQEMQASGETLRVSFESLAPQLNMPIAAGQRWICRPLSRTLLGTVMFESQLTEGPKVIEKINVQTKIERQQQVVVCVGRLERGDIITSRHVRMEETWLDRNLPTLVRSDRDVLGLEAGKPMAVGTMLDSRDVRPSVLASKGDPLTVIFLSGNLKVQMRGRAMEEGKLHDGVTVRNETTGNTYQATLIGKRLAVVGGTLTEAEEQQLRDAR